MVTCRLLCTAQVKTGAQSQASRQENTMAPPPPVHTSRPESSPSVALSVCCSDTSVCDDGCAIAIIMLCTEAQKTRSSAHFPGHWVLRHNQGIEDHSGWQRKRVVNQQNSEHGPLQTTDTL
ncbi:hypothetical protein E2C01_021595 [Portunus trituberculatus]|uniref:Uncharacterized protein n=1 Tax=Portunus trituberculatus TaxID=210409 RepID=A0A5B7E308_PORTR|nr:hypothetical protein [Portunus trituberculatus]